MGIQFYIYPPDGGKGTFACGFSYSNFSGICAAVTERAAAQRLPVPPAWAALDDQVGRECVGALDTAGCRTACEFLRKLLPEEPYDSADDVEDWDNPPKPLEYYQNKPGPRARTREEEYNDGAIEALANACEKAAELGGSLHGG